MSKVETAVLMVCGFGSGIFYGKFIFDGSFPMVINFLSFIGLISLFMFVYFGLMIELFVRSNRE